jgi:excisionase family DNA binding protein
MSLAMTDRPRTVDVVALFCGVSAKTVRRAIERGDLEAARLGDHGALRVRPDAIDEWFARRSTRRSSTRQAEVAPVLPVATGGRRRRQRIPTPLRVGEDMGMR